MKLRLLTLITFLLACNYFAAFSETGIGSFLASNDERSQLWDAAYYGQLDYIQKRFEIIKTNGSEELKRQVRPSELIAEAISGRQYEVLKWCLREDPNPEILPGCFRAKQMEMAAAKLILAENPKLKPQIADEILFNTVLSENVELVEFLLNSEIKQSFQLNRSLALAVQKRRFEIISKLLNHGADPYARVVDRYSTAQWAIKLKSANLLRALDRDRKFQNELKELEKEFPDAPQSPFLGLWVYQKEGFGSFSLTIYSDGTGVYGGDIGAMPCVWRGSTAGIKLSMLSPNDHPVSTDVLELTIAGEKLVVQGVGQREATELVKIKNPSQVRGSARRPHFFRIEGVRIVNGTNLVMQVNGHMGSISLETLIRGAKATGYGFEVVEDNLVRWADFKKGEIPASMSVDAMEAPFVNQYANPMYSRNWDKLYFNHETKAITKMGFEYTLFPSTTTEYYHGPDSGPYGENVQSFVLLAKKPFSHGKDWLMVFLLKTKDP